MAADAACFPKLFVYELEDKWRDPTQHTVANVLGQATVGTTPIPISPGLTVYAVGQFALGEIIFQRARAYSCRTWDANEADLFFIPAFSARFLNHSSRAGVANPLSVVMARVLVNKSAHGWEGSWPLIGGWPPRNRGPLSNVSALKRLGGRDHFLVQPRNGAPIERSPFAELRYCSEKPACLFVWNALPSRIPSEVVLCSMPAS